MENPTPTNTISQTEGGRPGASPGNPRRLENTRILVRMAIGWRDTLLSTEPVINDRSTGEFFGALAELS
jgi:hypothetical protein